MDNPNKTLSIASPIYNFSRFIPDMLKSIAEEALHYSIEILFIDGQSTDDTQAIIESWQRDYPNIRYVKALKKGGFDLDTTKSSEYTNARFCWLFSGDDIFIQGSLGFLLGVINQHDPDIILLRHNECNFNMDFIKEWPVLDLNENRLFDLHDPEDRKEYLSLSLTSEAFFSFLSGMVVKRSTWLQGQLSPEVDGSCWAHIGRIWRLAFQKSFRLYYAARPLLDRRGENDTFSADGMLNRFRIQTLGLLDTVQFAIGDGDQKIINDDHQIIEALKRVIRFEVYPSWYNAVVANMIEQNASRSDFDRLRHMMQSVGLEEKALSYNTHTEHARTL